MITIDLREKRTQELDGPVDIAVAGDDLVETLRFVCPARLAGISVRRYGLAINIARPDGQAFCEDLVISRGLYADYPVTSKITLAGVYGYALCFTYRDKTLWYKGGTFRVVGAVNARGITLQATPPTIIEAIEGRLSDLETQQAGNRDYNVLNHLPSINKVTLMGNRSLAEIPLSNTEIESMF